MNKQIIEINISSTKDTPRYLEILRKYNIKLTKDCGGRKTDRRTILDSEVTDLDDEETRMSAARQGDALKGIISLIDNHKKKRGNKLPTVKSIQTFIQKEKEKMVIEGAGYGEFQAFLYNLLNIKMKEYYGVGILPEQEGIRAIPQEIAVHVVPELEIPLIIDRRSPKEIDVNEIVEKVLSKNESLADSELIIQTIKKLIGMND